MLPAISGSTVDGNDWLDPQWRAGAEAWVTERLAALSTPVTGPIEQTRVRPWSVSLRVPTAAGAYWFKANTFGCRYEAGLASALGWWAPDAVLVPVAVEPDRGWLLTADAGPILRETSPSLDDWASLLASYAQLQQALAVRADEMVALGVPDQRPRLLPGLLAGLLDDPAVRADLGTDRLAAITAVVPAYETWCAELAGDGLGASLQHDDLHDGNVFVNGRFFDWGDASVAHPFGTLLVTLSSAGYTFGLDPGAPELLRLRDAYLSAWPGDPVALRHSATLACRVTRVSRALSWRRSLDRSALPLDDDVRTAPADWLGELTEPDVI
ncbi:phosphotransferase [Asanoa ishikariensis]|uniref:Phosphotransferase enzyme family protein n=1 Tax=Asanoa ishikariensis TaxID=137265 RepID=A0A1H3UNT7_9ACTN|nr:phosphotransferase [Asanoa ishikariensis]GIF69085.1 phosphotransferase [Asanoa ishikariensis]SDZ64054.1 Phosphotransferase enzyme family protein [Asanoa ishikariensis]